jgi:hypothetical protein
MTMRRLAVLINGLPPESATRYAMEHPGDEADLRWTDTNFLLAHLANMSHAQFRVAWSAGQLKGKPPALDPILPPDDIRAEREKREAKEARKAIQLAELRGLGTGTNRARELPEHLRRLIPGSTPRASKESTSASLEKVRALGSGARKATPVSPETAAGMRP